MDILMQAPQVLIIELGSQYTLLIQRILQELGVRSVILNPAVAGKWIRKNQPKAIILSGGSASVYDPDAPQVPPEVFFVAQPDGRPIHVLGICYGMQWIAHRFGGKVESVGVNRDYGQTPIILFYGSTPYGIFASTAYEQSVWMSHGDSVTESPNDFLIVARTESFGIAAIHRGSVWGVQFHPEVTHTEFGQKMFQNFLIISECRLDWTPTSIVSSIQNQMRTELDGQTVLMGFSGGVDSTTVACILSPVLGSRLLGIVIDGGQLREGELQEIHQHAMAAGITLRCIDARHDFSQAMAGIIDAEEKRRRFKKVYQEIFVDVAHQIDATAVIQGTLAPDRIESGATGGAHIKSHHNVGLTMDGLTQIHPVQHLFKHEIRALARELDLPDSVWKRQPFPGPGLFVRVVGVPATPDNLDIIRWADARVKEILVRHGLYDEISQSVVAYLGINTVGVKGDGRVYGGAICVRLVKTVDFMTAHIVHLPNPVEEEICSTLTKHPKIVRVFFDKTSKPPATIELE
jgi:GMP synthase (glutamine-hydrolysing)